ncbi:Ankyrin repeats (3 copies) [Piscirickettsia salmonis]|uniref:Ankyrin n=1 Tax=Piscirickettsia salmonis TaxID=1238 RepID=A0A1L6TBP3_PISSA|nr:ankyrin repeat domain-containing protein [Piscirickettsia salmonis]AKP73921.1 ankryin [Piscirickettsia salmonis LF-89 = ATCC VR-1361]ALB22739.1 ankyrin [Piscirickettsia salmonis]ALY02738.1 ankryin [Piscirickettsia salmonis]AMA42284.1 ankryin [Piscirickettsia salmonis]AOS34759.1 ankryin [Piscirickettsia salmonis]
MPGRLIRPKNTASVSSFLFTAVRSEDPERIARIPTYLDSGADPNTRYLLEEISYSSTDAAIKWGSPEVVQLLLNKGGNPYLNTRGVQWPDDNKIKKQIIDLIFEHSQFKIPTDVLGQLLFWGVEHDHIDIVQRTLEMGADPNEYYYLRGSHHKKSLTPFQLAVKLKRRGEMIPLLLQYEANFDLKFHKENSEDPLTYARANDDDSRFFDFLLDQYHKQISACSQLEGGIGLEQVRVKLGPEQTQGRPLNTELDYLVAGFLVGKDHQFNFAEFQKQIKIDKSQSQSQSQSLEEQRKEENRESWGYFCSKVAGSGNSPKTQALKSFQGCEPTKRAIRGLIATAAQRRGDDEWRPTSLKRLCKMLKKENYSFLLDLLGIKKHQVTADNLRSIAIYDCIGKVDSSGYACDYFSIKRIGKPREGYIYADQTKFFNNIRDKKHPHFLFQDRYNVIEEYVIEPALEPIW